MSENEMLEADRIIIGENVSFKRFNGKLILSTAKREEMPLFTFDRNLAAECKINGAKSFV
jgi:hypothetical protein